MAETTISNFLDDYSQIKEITAEVDINLPEIQIEIPDLIPDEFDVFE